MKIKNCLHQNGKKLCPDYFLRRIILFCCEELGLPTEYIKEVNFYNTRRTNRPRRQKGKKRERWVWYPAFSGRAYLEGREISVRVSADNFSFPCETVAHRNTASVTLRDRVETLVYVTAHETAHHKQYKEGSTTRRGRKGGGSEEITDRYAIQVLKTYNQSREHLLTEWSSRRILKKT